MVVAQYYLVEQIYILADLSVFIRMDYAIGHDLMCRNSPQ